MLLGTATTRQILSVIIVLPATYLQTVNISGNQILCEAIEFSKQVVPAVTQIDCLSAGGFPAVVKAL